MPVNEVTVYVPALLTKSSALLVGLPSKRKPQAPVSRRSRWCWPKSLGASCRVTLEIETSNTRFTPIPMVVTKVQRDVGQLHLDVTNDFALGCCRERVASFRQDLYHIFCEITSRVVAIMLAGENESTLYTAWYCKSVISYITMATCTGTSPALALPSGSSNVFSLS